MAGKTVVESFIDGCRGNSVGGDMGGGMGGGEEGRPAAIVGHEASEARDRLCEINVIFERRITSIILPDIPCIPSKLGTLSVLKQFTSGISSTK